jgi:hypothetical protein
LDYKVPGTNVNGLLRIHETTRPSQFWQISAVPDQQFHFPRLGLMVIAYYRPGRDGGGDKSPEQVAIRKEIKGCLAPLLKLEQEAGVEKN